MDKQETIHILKNTGYIGNDVGVAFDVAIKSMEKLEQIEQIVNSWEHGSNSEVKAILKMIDIKEVLNNDSITS